MRNLKGMDVKQTTETEIGKHVWKCTGYSMEWIIKQKEGKSITAVFEMIVQATIRDFIFAARIHMTVTT
jgi:hypothetical protein